jgi:hypothetical protein
MLSNIMDVHYIGHKMSKSVQADSSPPRCTACDQPLRTINSTCWVTMRFDPEDNAYVNDDSPGNADIEYSCANCSAKVDPEGIIF